MATNKIEYMDTLREGTDKINDAIDSVNTFQTQIDTIVIDGDSSVEAAQARVDVEGIAHTTLKARLDTEMTAVTTQLGDRVETAVFNQFKTEATTQLAETAKKTEVQSLVTNKAEKTQLAITDSNVSATNLRVDNLVIPLSPENANVEVTDAHVSSAKNKTFTTVRNRFEEIENNTFFKAVNTVINGNFANGTTGWKSVLGGISTNANILTLRATARYGAVYKTIDTIVNNKIYVSVDVKANSNQVILNFKKNTTPWTIVASKAHTGSNSYERLSIVGKLTDVGVLDFEVRDERVSGWNDVLIKNAFSLDLTATFGTGNEPTVDEMDRIMSHYQDSWFDGTVNISDHKKFLTYMLGEIKKAKAAGVITKESITGIMIAPSAIDMSKTDFMVKGKNLFNVETISVADTWVNYVTGAKQVYPTNPSIQGFQYSEPIPLEPNTPYSRKYGNIDGTTAGTSFFDIHGVFISGATGNTFTTPANVSYAILNVRKGRLNDQLEKGSVSTSYEPFMIIPKYGAPMPKSSIYQMQLPSKLYAVVGKEVNVYFDNLMIDDAVKYNVDVTCTIGTQQDERFTVVPSATGTSPLTITIYKDYDDSEQGLATVNSSVVVADINKGSGQNKKYLQIGDSTTHNMANTGALADNFGVDVMDLTQLGTQGTAPNLHEGYPGKTTSFLHGDAASPFVFSGAFNFSQYMTTQGYTGVDYVGIHLGINDIYGLTYTTINAKIDSTLTKFEEMITSIHAYDQNIKVGILLTVLPSSTQDGIGYAAGNGQPRWRYKRNVVLFNAEIIKKFTGRENANIYVVPFSTNVDTVHNYSFDVARPVNSRSTIMVSRQTNGIHPATDGSEQMADAVYYWIKNIV